jgi:hypothetical protein
MLGKVRVLMFTGFMLLNVASTYAASGPPLCCDSFDGTTALNCTPASPEGTCTGTVVSLNCGEPSALECVPEVKKLAMAIGRNPGYGSAGKDCRCVTISVVSP